MIRAGGGWHSQHLSRSPASAGRDSAGVALFGGPGSRESRLWVFGERFSAGWPWKGLRILGLESLPKRKIRFMMETLGLNRG